MNYLQNKRLATIQNKHKGLKCLRSRNPEYRLPLGAFPYISVVTITAFPGTNLIPEWKLG